ncbi:MAG: ABC transporter ATP-binding protein [Gammaproteobacteria bacterium]|nr:ABC transporter ATP-binding protein [Gammaproteobacteria bacterium]
MADLSLTGIHKSYGAVRAVNDVSFDIPSGEFVVLVGASGCGKSTLLRSIAGLEDISSGEIVLGGRSITTLAPRDRNLAMVFQSYALYPYLSVAENIAFGLRARKTPEAEIKKQVNWAADVLDIVDYLDRYPRELSGGQRQRVAIGRAIVREADLYLFDEPLSNLDAKLRDGMREELKRLHARLGKTFIYVTHDQIEAMTLAERIILLKDGQIEQSGTPLELFEKPRNTFVAGFLGSPPMNFVEVTINDNQMILPDGQVLSDCHAADGEYIWGVRPEHFSASDLGNLKVNLELIQPTGSRAYGTFYLAETHMVAELDAHATNRDETRLTVAMQRTQLFDKASGMAHTGQVP